MWKSALLGIILSVSAIAEAQTPQELQELVQDAIQKQKAGDLEGAVTEYRQFPKMHPEATAIHSNLRAVLAYYKWQRRLLVRRVLGVDLRQLRCRFGDFPYWATAICGWARRRT
jgi:hypothetical protein